MEAVMNFPRVGVQISRPRVTLISLLLVPIMIWSGCTFNLPAFISKAEADLPVLIQMAETIATIVSMTATQNPPSQSEIFAINNIGTQATNGLTAIQNLYSSYKSANSATTIADIIAAGNALTANLNQLLAAASIKDPALLARVTTAVNLIVSSVNGFLSLLPQVTSLKLSRKALRAKVAALPTAADLRLTWEQQVHVPLVKK